MAPIVADAWGYPMVFVRGGPISITCTCSGADRLIKGQGPGGKSNLA